MGNEMDGREGRRDLPLGKSEINITQYSSSKGNKVSNWFHDVPIEFPPSQTSHYSPDLIEKEKRNIGR